MSDPRPGGALPSDPRPPSPRPGGLLRGLAQILLIPIVLGGAILATPYINGEIYPPNPILRPFIDLSCRARLALPVGFRTLYYPIVCDFEQFAASDVGPDGTEACGMACDTAVGAVCPDGFTCVSGGCQNEAICANTCGATCTTSADCSDGLSCLIDDPPYGHRPCGDGDTCICYNFSICSDPGELACGTTCETSYDCATGLQCRFGLCESRDSEYCSGCGIDCRSSAECPGGFTCVLNSEYDPTNEVYRGASCWSETACGPLPDYAVVMPSLDPSCIGGGCVEVPVPGEPVSNCGDSICAAEEVGTCLEDCPVSVTCGDGICTYGENSDNCAYDCPSGSGSSCGSPCTSNADCSDLGPNPICLSSGCYDGQTCGEEESEEAQEEEGGGSEGGGGSSTSVCGNGTVESGEACDGFGNGSCNWNDEYCTNGCNCAVLP